MDLRRFMRWDGDMSIDAVLKAARGIDDGVIHGDLSTAIRARETPASPRREHRGEDQEAKLRGSWTEGVDPSRGQRIPCGAVT